MNSVFNQAVSLISKGSTSDAVYVNNCLEEVIKHLTVNRQQVDLFFSIYIKLLDRLFGEDVAKSATEVNANTAWVKGVQGGWLRALMAAGAVRSTSFETTSTRSTNSNFQAVRGVNASYIDSIPPPTSSILQKLAPFSAMFDILAKIQGGYEIKVNLLPTKLQMYIVEHPVYHAIQAQLQQHVAHVLLKYPLHSANQRNHITHKGALLLDAVEYFLVCMLRYPTISHTIFLAPDTTVGTSSSTISRTSPLDTLQNRGVSAWIRGLPYLALLQEYLKEYIPIAQAAQLSGDLSGGTPTANTVEGNGLELDTQRLRYRELFVQLAVAYWIDCAVILKSDHHKVGVLRKAMTGGPAASSADVMGAVGVGMERPHPPPTEVVLLDSGSLRWTVATMQCSYLLTLRVLAEPSLLKRIEQLGDTHNAVFPIGRSPAFSSHRGTMQPAASANAPGSWEVLRVPVFDMLNCIFAKAETVAVDAQVVSLAVELWILWLQPWNAITICNSSAGVLPNRTANIVPFVPEWRPYIAANLHFYTTLLSNFLRLVSKWSLHITEMEGYQNLIALERVLQVFSPALVQCIDELTHGFRAWYAPLQHNARRQGGGRDSLLRSHLRGAGAAGVAATPMSFAPYATRAPHTEGYESPAQQETDASAPSRPPTAPQLLRLMQLQHEALFPDRRIDDLQDCGITDFKSSAAEFATNIVSTLNQINENLSLVTDPSTRLFNAVVKEIRRNFGLPTEEGARNKYTDRLLTCMKCVVRLVPESAAGNVTAGTQAGASATGRRGCTGHAADSSARDVYSGRLTSLGKQQILEGRSRCRVEDVLEPRALTVDPLDCPLCSYEFPPLARLLVHLSKQLNEHFHLPADNQQMMRSWETIFKRAQSAAAPGDYFFALRITQSCFRFNLRFLATYRVFSSIAVAVLVAMLKRASLSPVLFLILVTVFALLSYRNSLIG